MTAMTMPRRRGTEDLERQEGAENDVANLPALQLAQVRTWRQSGDCNAGADDRTEVVDTLRGPVERNAATAEGAGAGFDGCSEGPPSSKPTSQWDRLFSCARQQTCLVERA